MIWLENPIDQLQEAKTVSVLNYPKILTIYEFGQEGESENRWPFPTRRYSRAPGALIH